jgi:hypothetical protein
VKKKTAENPFGPENCPLPSKPHPTVATRVRPNYQYLYSVHGALTPPVAETFAFYNYSKNTFKKIYHLAHNDSLPDPFYSPSLPNDSNNSYTDSTPPNGPNHYS